MHITRTELEYKISTFLLKTNRKHDVVALIAALIDEWENAEKRVDDARFEGYRDGCKVGFHLGHDAAHQSYVDAFQHFVDDLENE
jgi:hypothetical protein